MRLGNRSFLFGYSVIATARAGDGRYAHTFGGPPDRRGAARAECGGLLLHLLHRFDLADPTVPVRVPGVRWLPLYYCFDFRANAVGYRLVSDDAMVVYRVPDEANVAAEEEWPADDYPAEFPRSPVVVEPHPYDPTDLDDAYVWAGVFGVGRQSPRRRAAVRRRAVKDAEMCGGTPPETDAEFEAALCGPFLQGEPADICLNPVCPNHTRPGRLTAIALVPAEPVPGVLTFGAMGRGVELIVQMCPDCRAIRVENQCT